MLHQLLLLRKLVVVVMLSVLLLTRRGTRGGSRGVEYHRVLLRTDAAAVTVDVLVQIEIITVRHRAGLGLTAGPVVSRL